MARYRVAFDGKWQGRFADLDDATDRARAVAETGRITSSYGGAIYDRISSPYSLRVEPTKGSGRGTIESGARVSDRPDVR